MSNHRHLTWAFATNQVEANVTEQIRMDSQAANCKTQINVFWHAARLAAQLLCKPAVGGFIILLRFQMDPECGYNGVPMAMQRTTNPSSRSNEGMGNDHRRPPVA